MKFSNVFPGYCRIREPNIEYLSYLTFKAKGSKRSINEFANFNVYDDIKQKLMSMSIPTLVVMKNGKIVQQVSGARPKNAILEML